MWGTLFKCNNNKIRVQKINTQSDAFCLFQKTRRYSTFTFSQLLGVLSTIFFVFFTPGEEYVQFPLSVCKKLPC